MITVTVVVEGGMISRYHSQGHAEDNQDHTGLKVCNGLSAMEYQFLYSVKGLCPELKTEFKVEKGDFRMKFLSNKATLAEEETVYRILGRALMIGVEMLKNCHPQAIDVIIKDKR